MKSCMLVYMHFERNLLNIGELFFEETFYRETKHTYYVQECTPPPSKILTVRGTFK